MHATRIACLAAVLALGAGGCSWFRSKPVEPAVSEEAAAAEAAARNEATTEAIAPAESAAPVAAAAAPADPAQGPVAAAMDFLAMHQRLGNSGLPQRADMAAYDAFLCPSLAQSIRAAQVRQEVARAEHPNDKPPFVEGDLFSSLFEGPEGFAPGDAEADGAVARLPVKMSAGAGEQATRWTDTFVLRLDDGIWCLEDVEYGGKWAFANKGKLSALLAAP